MRDARYGGCQSTVPSMALLSSPADAALQVKIALCQIKVTSDKDENIQSAKRYVEVLFFRSSVTSPGQGCADCAIGLHSSGIHIVGVQPPSCLKNT